MKKLFIIIFIGYLSNVLASEIDWNTTQITSQSHFSFLEEIFDDNVYLHPKVKPVNYTRHNLATSSLSNFKNAIKNFLSNENIPSHFLQIHTASRYEDERLAYKFNNNLPLNSYLYFNLFTGVDYFNNSTQNSKYSYVYYGTKLFANIDNTLFIDSYWWTGHFEGDEEFYRTSPILDSWSQQPNENEQVSVDNASGKIIYKKKYVLLSIGRGKHVIGNRAIFKN